MLIEIIITCEIEIIIKCEILDNELVLVLQYMS